jgi:hypothetical protein
MLANAEFPCVPPFVSPDLLSITDRHFQTKDLLEKIPNFPCLYQHSTSGTYYGIKKVSGKKKSHSLDTSDRKLAGLLPPTPVNQPRNNPEWRATEGRSHRYAPAFQFRHKPPRRTPFASFWQIVPLSSVHWQPNRRKWSGRP